MAKRSVQTLTVDGEVFEVTEDRPGGYHFAWVSGPNKNFGYSLQNSPPISMTTEELEDDIRQWLATIDPETGYTSDDEDDNVRDPNKPPLGWPPRA